jgi:hemolysin activation/secretion protein
LRRHAKPRYIYGTLSLGKIYTFSSKESIAGTLRAQGTPNALIPSEQFGLGGFSTVRGYEENVFISDNGVCANFELRTRPISFFKKAKDELKFLAFMDYGWGYNYHAFDGIKKTATLWGTGLGARYNINPYLSFRADYGFKLHHVSFDDNKLGQWHLGGTASY